MMKVSRYGIREDGNPVVEVTTYTPVPPEHPMAVEVEGENGTWAKVSVANSLESLNAAPTDKIGFDQAKRNLEEIVRQRKEQASQEREDDRAARNAKRIQVITELQAKGVSSEALEYLFGGSFS